MYTFYFITFDNKKTVNCTIDLQKMLSLDSGLEKCGTLFLHSMYRNVKKCYIDGKLFYPRCTEK